MRLPFEDPGGPESALFRLIKWEESRRMQSWFQGKPGNRLPAGATGGPFSNSPSSDGLTRIPID
jgi:hypothetical protein